MESKWWHWFGFGANLFGGKGMRAESQVGQSLLRAWVLSSLPLLPSYFMPPSGLPHCHGCYMSGLLSIILITASTATALLRGVRYLGDKMKKQQHGTLFMAIVRLAPGSSANLYSVKGFWLITFY